MWRNVKKFVFVEYFEVLFIVQKYCLVIMKIVLMVVEKFLLVQFIVKFFFKGQMIIWKGMNGVCFVYEYMGQFNKELVRFKMIFVCGYVMILDFYYKFNNWDVVNF